MIEVLPILVFGFFVLNWLFKVGNEARSEFYAEQNSRNFRAHQILTVDEDTQSGDRQREQIAVQQQEAAMFMQQDTALDHSHHHHPEA